MLYDTDYQAIKYAEGKLTEEEYAEMKAKRQSWRDEIKQIKGTNGLIDESNANGQTGQSTKKDVEAIKKATACYTKAFMQFMERFNIGAESKETIKHELNKAIQETEGEPVKEKADDEEDKAQ